MGFARFFQDWRQREIVTVLGLGLLMLILWRIPLFGLLFYPFQLFNTFVHELSHGLVAIATGGGFNRFVVRPDLSGTAWSVGGIQWIIVSAGYIGSALFGGILTILAAWGAPARRVLFWLGGALGLLCLLFVRNLFGIVTGFGLAAGLILAGRRLGPLWADGLLLLLAVQAMLNSLDSMFDLVGFSLALGGPRTDAQIMQDTTGIPAIFWALLWTTISVVILIVSLRVAYYRRPDPIVRQRAGG
jgi:hypothetical protein